MYALQQLAGDERGDDLGHQVQTALDNGWRMEQLAEMAEAVAAARCNTDGLEQSFDLVVSGPEAAGIATRDTAAVMHALLAEAKNEVLLVGYAFYHAQPLFEPLAVRLAADPELRVWFCLQIGRKPNDTSLSSEIVRRFADEFVLHHWPWMPRPDVFYDPRALDRDGQRRSSLHAKCVVVDRSAALITSANFTEAAQERNIECGIVIRHRPFVERLYRYFETLCQLQQLRRCELPSG